jgi:hypothetical protein
MIEVADDADARGVGRPHRETRAGDAEMVHRLRAEDLVRPQVRALGEQPDIDLAERWREAVRILDEVRHDIGLAGAPLHPETVGLGLLARDHPFVESGRIAQAQLAEMRAVVRRHRRYPRRAGQECAQHAVALAVAVRPQHGERIAMPARADGRQVLCAHDSGRTRQMRSAYSRMLRSDENAPMPATLRTALRVQTSRSR